MTTKHNQRYFIFGSMLLGLMFLMFAEYSSPCFAELTTKADRRQFILNTLKQHSPTGYFIVNTVDVSKAPKGMTWNKYDFDFGDHQTELEMVADLGTVVHETNHVYASRMPYIILDGKAIRGNYYAYYIGEETISIKITETFPARKIADLIPETLRDFRYQTYIAGSDDSLSTQQEGIYGLLDEFNSYYLDTQTEYDLLPWFQGISEWDWPVTQTYLNMTHSNYLAHGEFKLYILGYLLYAKKNYPKTYQTILKNQDLKRVFMTIDTHWSKLITDYFQNFEAQLNFLESKGIKASLWNEDYMFRVPNSKYSYGLELLKRRSEYEQFQAEIAQPQYQEILQELQI